ncbi:flagellar filament capping protein FliD [Alcaligenaceae bacterium CGII-47]|nr:flagellar filament capping protein FliD [Alcaligenaceae bacterium CGII-47]
MGMSGLPLEDLLNNLRKNENNALTLIQNRKVITESKLSAYGKLQASVTALQAASEVVAGQSNAFGALKATTGSDAFTASASTTAIPGQYNVQIDTLASSQTLVAAGQADRTTAIGVGGSIAITLANGTTHTLDMADKNTSLNGLVEAINADPDIGVNATLVNDGTGTPHRLLLTARDTGTEASVATIEVTGNTDLQDFIGFDQVGGTTSNFSEQAATDATLSINGIGITSQTNTIKDAIDGIELTLTKVTTAPETLSVTRDNAAATKAVNDFVNAYNSLQDTIKTLTQYDTSAQASSALTGDALSRKVQSEMRNAVNNAAGSGTTLRSLSQIGVTTDPKTGKLSVDNAKLNTALTNHPDDVASIFTGTSGAGKLMSETAERYTRSGGQFSIARDGLGRTLDSITKQYNATADRIDQRMETYRQQFVRLDTMVVQMNSISSYLTQQLGMLENLSSSKK